MWSFCDPPPQAHTPLTCGTMECAQSQRSLQNARCGTFPSWGKRGLQRKGLLPLQALILPRRISRHALKLLGEIAAIRITELIGKLGNGLMAGRRDDRFGLFYFLANDVFIGGDAESVFEKVEEIGATHVRFLR